MNKSYFDKAFLQAVEMFRKLAPKDTGNLAYNAIKYKWVAENKFVIYVDVGDVGVVKKRVKGIAPYMPFTNEVWISPRWNGKQNPNEGWWNDACEKVIHFLAKILKGELQ